MRNITTAAAIGLLAIVAAACSQREDNALNDVNAEATANVADSGGGSTTVGDGIASAGFPEGSRIIVENGVTYRVEPGGVRVALGPNDSRIVVEDGVRYRVDPGGTRVRIDDTGAAVSVGPGGVDATIPVGGNTSVTVNTN